MALPKTGNILEQAITMQTLSEQVRQLEQSGTFDQAWYVQHYSDVAQSTLSPAEHFIRIGQHIGRRPNGAASGERFTGEVRADVDSPTPQEAMHSHDGRKAAIALASRADDQSIARLALVSHPPVKTYDQYKSEIFSRMNMLSDQPYFPVNVSIDTDYTGPPHATSFDSFISKRQRSEAVKQMTRMLKFGIVAINPQPGVHAARDEDGEFIRYRSIMADKEFIDRLPPWMIIHIHAFYPDVVEEMLSYFHGDSKKGRFFITTTTQKNYDAITKILDDQGFSSYKILLIDNKGRDIGPFLDYAVDYASDGDVICHVHTKKSPDVGGSYGEKWRNQLYGALLTQTAVDAFEDRQLGLLFPDTSRSVGWGKNLPLCKQIAEYFGRQPSSHPGPMPVGNMFLARVEVARAMQDATHDFEWPREPVPYDGSILHAIERMWSMACEHAGFQWAAIHSPYGDHASADTQTRPAGARRTKG